MSLQVEEKANIPAGVLNFARPYTWIATKNVRWALHRLFYFIA